MQSDQAIIETKNKLIISIQLKNKLNEKQASCVLSHAVCLIQYKTRAKTLQNRNKNKIANERRIKPAKQTNNNYLDRVSEWVRAMPHTSLLIWLMRTTYHHLIIFQTAEKWQYENCDENEQVKTEQTLQYLIAEADANDMNKNNKYQKLNFIYGWDFLKTELLCMVWSYWADS